MRTEVIRRKHAKDDEGDDFLNHLELHGSEAAVADAVGRYLEAVFEEGDAPAHDDDLPQRLILKLQVPVPGNRHENVGANEKNNCPHKWIRCAAP